VADDQILPLWANRIWNRLIVEVTFRKRRLPKGNASSGTYAYSLEEIMGMLDVLPGHVVPVVARLRRWGYAVLESGSMQRLCNVSGFGARK
jgi:hypothetical protein